MNSNFLLIDDKKGREVAELNDIKCIGALTLLYKAKEKGFFPEVRFYFKKLLQFKRFYSKSVMNYLLEIANETQL